MSTRAEASDDTSNREIVVSRVVGAPQALVWKAITSPEHVVRWWGPRGFTMTVKTMDVKPGGKWTHILHGSDGTDYPGEAVFIEVVAPERLVFRHAGGRKGGTPIAFLSTWTILPSGDGRTEVKIRMVFATASLRDQVEKDYGAVEGGKQTLERLAEHLPAMAPSMPR